MIKQIESTGSYLRSLRIEEIIGILFLPLILLIMIYARLYTFIAIGPSLAPPGGGLWQIGYTILIVIGFYALLWIRPDNRILSVIRDYAPFLFVLAIYMNLYDMIYFINPNDIHYTLAVFDEWLFGIQPTVWAEQFYHPRLTDWFSFAYMSYYWITLLLLSWLYLKKRYREFRMVIFTMMIAYYIGFMGYILFPAASPYMVIPDYYSIDIWKGTSFISKWVQALVNLSPDRVRDAFPSMHNAITLLTMIMAWRYQRIIFWILLPLAVSLVLATVYLRYHFVVDILAGVIVTFLALYLSPRLDSWWRQWQKNKGSQSFDEKLLQV